MVMVENMNPDNIPFNALIAQPTNSGKTRYLVNLLSTTFQGKFDYIFSSVQHSSTTLHMTVLEKMVRTYLSCFYSKTRLMMGFRLSVTCMREQIH